MNDCYKTTASLYFHPKVIAASCLMMSQIYCQKMCLIKQTLQEGWLQAIDEDLTMEMVLACKDEIKKCYVVDKPISTHS